MKRILFWLAGAWLLVAIGGPMLLGFAVIVYFLSCILVAVTHN